MSKLLTYLRDPIWQSIAVLVALVAIYFSAFTSSGVQAELSIYHNQKIKFEDYQLPTDQIRLVLLGTNEENSHAVVDYYVIANRSQKPILATDFTSPLTLSKGASSPKIFLVSSCGTPAKDTLYQPNSSTAVALSWSKLGDKWTAKPTLLNPGDYSCITVISEEAGTAEKTAPPRDRLLWDGRIVNVQIKGYDSIEEYYKHVGGKWTDHLQSEITLNGFGAYWFTAIQLLFFYATANLARKAGLLGPNSAGDLLKLTGIVVLSTGSAEVLVDIFINANLFRLHPVVWFYLLGHLGFATWLIARVKRRRGLTQHL